MVYGCVVYGDVRQYVVMFCVASSNFDIKDGTSCMFTFTLLVFYTMIDWHSYPRP